MKLCAKLQRIEINEKRKKRSKKGGHRKER